MSRRRRADTSSTWRHCPRCRAPMTRWGAVAAVPEQLWPDWDPGRWLLPVPVVGVVIVAALLHFVPGLAELLSRRRSGELLITLVMGAAFLWASLWAWTSYRARLRRRGQLGAQADAADWVCPACLHLDRP